MPRSTPQYAAVVLAAGHGARFWPYNEVRNKCAFPIANEPVIRRLCRQLYGLGVNQIVVVTAASDSSVRAALRDLPDRQPQFTTQAHQIGTADAALCGLAALGDDVTGALIVSGDLVVASQDLAATLARYRATGETTVLAERLTGPPNDWLCAAIGGEGESLRLVAVEGHSRDAKWRLPGVTALPRRHWEILGEVPPVMRHVPVGGMPPPERELAEALAMLADERDRPGAVAAAHPLIDMDKPWHIMEATALVLREMADGIAERIDPAARIAPGAEISGPVVVGVGAEIGNRVTLQGPAWIGPGARVINGAIVGAGCVIGAGTRVSDYCLLNAGSVVGDECVVGHGAEFEGVMLFRSYLYHYCEIYGVLGEAVDIGAATVNGTLRFDDGLSTPRIGGRREHPRDGANCTYIGDYSRTGVNVITQPGVRIGCYTCVGAGVVVYRDIPSRQLVLLKQELETRPWGPERYGW